MIRQPEVHQERVYGPVDYLLTGIYACLAAYATGISVGSPSAAWMFVAIIAAGTLFSFTVQWLIGDQPVVKFDGMMYLMVGIATFMFHEDLSKMVPDQPFVDQLAHTGTLCWLLALGSFFTWRDGTLLFQAVPSIALFGMVGAFDTFVGAPFLFFAFLVCLATLFARAHRRQMIEQAEASGYKAMLAREEEAAGGATTQGGARLQAILQGPWKWMAGPEWALASALTIVMISLMGAPALRIALKPIEGQIKITPPPLTTAQSQAIFGSSSIGRATIGTGPHFRPTGRPILIADTRGVPRYLRERTYALYNSLNGSGGGWEFGGVARASANIGALQDHNVKSIREWSFSEIKHPVAVPFKITLLDAGTPALPVPGDMKPDERSTSLIRVEGDGPTPEPNSDGTFKTNLGTGEIPPVYSGTAYTSDSSFVPTTAVDNIPDNSPLHDYTDTSSIPQSIVDYAQQVTKGATSDYQKAYQIKRAIENTCVYDLSAPATPSGQDPVAYFLFTSHRGYCDLFASAMTLMARSVGIPSRYATGFYPINLTHAKPPNDSAWLLTDAEAHAWSELFFKDAGWVDFDATEGAASAPGEGRGQVGALWYRAAWVKSALNFSIVILLLGGAAFAFLSYKKAMKGKALTRDDVGREYSRFVSAMQRLSGKRRLPSQTPAEFLKANEQVLGSHRDAAEQLTQKYVNALYSPMEISESILQELRKDTDQFRRDLKSNGKAQEPVASPPK